jgi:uncharacterized protein (DUF2235 family)
MSKNIVVLSDGTGQEGGKGHDTNVYKLFRMLEDRTERQIVFYDQGIGTDRYKVAGNVAGAGFTENILQCYHFIYENYNAGDKIFLFGFSRGAATVRSLANFIHYFGILPKSRPELIKLAYDIYKVGREEREASHTAIPQNLAPQGTQSLADLRDTIIRGTPLNEQAEQFVHEHPNQWASIEFLGVWDTVPALGLPGAVIDTFVNFIPGWKHRYHDFTLHPSVKNAYHALSIDDDRKWFHPTIWDAYNDDYQKVEQVWFSGSHTDVGGGFREPGLADITLEWMVQKAVAHGIKLFLRSTKYWNFCIAPDPSDEFHPPRAGAGRIYPAEQRHWPESAKKTFGTPTLHASVIERAKRVNGYNPWILKEFPEHKIEPWNENFEYEGEEMSIRDYDEATWQERFGFDGQNINIMRPENFYDNLLKRGKWNDNRLQRDLTRWRASSK